MVVMRGNGGGDGGGDGDNGVNFLLIRHGTSRSNPLELRY